MESRAVSRKHISKRGGYFQKMLIVLTPVGFRFNVAPPSSPDLYMVAVKWEACLKGFLVHFSSPTIVACQ